jgi:hypothetical protein
MMKSQLTEKQQKLYREALRCTDDPKAQEHHRILRPRREKTRRDSYEALRRDSENGRVQGRGVVIVARDVLRKEVSPMAKEKTSRKVARKAAKVLSDKKSTKDEKSVAASALTQYEPSKKGKKKK